jgi:uncharacterized protein YceH (UPF0502 family)
VELSAAGQRVLGCLVEKAMATPQQYPLSLNALRTACNQTTGRQPVVDYDDEDVRAGLDELKHLQLVRTEYARGSRTPKTAHRLDEQLDLDDGQMAVLALLLLRGPQTVGELRSRSDRMHAFASLELVEAVLESLAAHRFGALAELQERRAGQKEARWVHRLGPADAADGATPAATTDGHGRHRAFHDAVLAGDWDTAIDQLADDVVFRSPAVHRPYEGRDAAALVLRAVAQVFEDFRYVDVLDAGDHVALVFEARVGDRQLQGLDHLRFDDTGRIAEFTVMVRPLSGLHALVERMRVLLESAGGT